VQHAILRQQRGTCIQQFIEDLNVRYLRMLGRQKYKCDRPVAQTLAELTHEWRFMANAFINDDSFDMGHERILTQPLECGRARAAEQTDELASSHVRPLLQVKAAT
jgi:hypothetical protein